MKHLYVIGNGFDCHHGMSTSYLDFEKWLEEKDSEVLCTINDLFGYCDKEWWQFFERNLATAVTSDIVHEEVRENYPDIASDDFSDGDWFNAEYAVESKLSEAYDEIRQAFQQWVAELEMGDENKKIELESKDALFLTFNYTPTLEKLYGIDENNILYIHGKAGTKDELVLGHGASEKEIEKMLEEDYPNYYKTEDDPVFFEEEGDELVTQRAKYAAIDGVYKQRKDVEKIIKDHEKWFASLNNVTHLYFYGHSFGDVDLPYFRKILSVVDKKNVQIEVSDYMGENKASIDEFMKSEGIKQYSIIDLNDKLLKK